MQYFLIDKRNGNKTEITRTDALVLLSNSHKGFRAVLEKLESNAQPARPQSIKLAVNVLQVEQ